MYKKITMYVRKSFTSLNNIFELYQNNEYHNS